MQDKAEAIRLDVLRANTAQDVFNVLEQVESLSSKSSDRWLWELVQNAVDAAQVLERDGGAVKETRVSITLNGTSLKFSHAGRPFSWEEITHLIYHGSTKLEDGSIGRYGSGFITTHVLSRRVRVSGGLGSEESFSFWLDRQGQNWREIKDRMDDSWTEFKNSVNHESGRSNLTTYEFPLNEVGRQAAEKGLEELPLILPYVMAFNSPILEFELDRLGTRTAWKRSAEQSTIGTPLRSISILRNDEVRIRVLLAETDEIQAATLVEVGGARAQTRGGLSEGLPTIFAAFPLRGTSWLRLPCVVNSRLFRTTTDRQGIVLGEAENEMNLTNKRLLERAQPLILSVVAEAALVADSDRCALATVGLPAEGTPDWLEDRSWLQGVLRILVDGLMRLSLVESTGSLVSPNDAIVPFSEDRNLDQMRELVERLLPGKAPRTSELCKRWIEVISGWSGIWDRTITQSPQLLTPGRLADRAKAAQSLDGLGVMLRGGRELATGWISDFIAWCSTDQKLTDGLLPNQLGQFTSNAGLAIDTGIPDELKDVCDLLSMPMRSRLLHPEISKPPWLPREDSTQFPGKVVRRAQEVAKQLAKDKRGQFCEATGRLLRWLAETRAWAEFESRVPVVTRSDSELVVGHVSRSDHLLAPSSSWDEKAQSYVDLFPPETLFADEYGGILTGADWDSLAEERLVYRGPIVVETERLDGDDIEALRIDSSRDLGEGHSLVQDTEVSNIPFLAAPKDHCIIDLIRSRTRAVRFLAFLVAYVIRSDSKWENRHSAPCKCGEVHEVYPTRWLRYIKLRQWVPVTVEKRKTEEQPSTENILRLAQDDPGLMAALVDDRGWQLLERLGLQPLVFVAPTQTKQRELARIARAMGENPSFESEVRKALERGERVRRNQRLGDMVQELVGRLLAVKLQGRAKVEPRYNRPGFDFYIRGELDDETDAGQVLVGDHMLEVKATVEGTVRMTPTQVRYSLHNASNYSLCVVALLPEDDVDKMSPDDLSSRIVVVPRIGGHVSGSYSKVSEVPVGRSDGIVWIENLDRIRYALDGSIWEVYGLSIDQWVDTILGG